MRAGLGLFEILTLAGSVLFAGLTAVGVGAIVFAPAPSRWLALATVACLAAAFACAVARAGLVRPARHPYRVLRDRYTLSFRTDEEPRQAGAYCARGRVRIETLFESLRDGQTSVPLQKFVTESTRLDPERVLKDWNYACRVASGGGEECEAAAHPLLSPSRSLQLDVSLPAPVAKGQTFTVVEELDFASDLDDEQPSYMFQVSYPTAVREVEISFEGLRPREPGYRIDREHGAVESGALEVADLGDGRSRVTYSWNRPQVGDELAIRWTWDPSSLPEAPPLAERLIAEALTRQGSLAEILASQAIPAAESTEPVASSEAGAKTAAEEHPTIKAARARERGLYGAGRRGPGESAKDDKD